MVTGFFALLGFIAVPIGDRTAYEHVKVFLETPEGRETTAVLSRTYTSVQHRLFSWVAQKLGVPRDAEIPSLAPGDLLPKSPQPQRPAKEAAAR